VRDYRGRIVLLSWVASISEPDIYHECIKISTLVQRPICSRLRGQPIGQPLQYDTICEGGGTKK